VLALVDFIYHGKQFSQRHGVTEQIALNEITIVTFQEFVLFERLDAFGNDLQVQGVRHDDDCLHDFHVLG
jgi:hypothetical protein